MEERAGIGAEGGKSGDELYGKQESEGEREKRAGAKDFRSCASRYRYN
jgi:hypothetical protein